MKLKLALTAMTLTFACATLAGCAPTAAETPTAGPTTSSTPTAEALPAVSLRTSCMLLFGSDLNGPVATATDIISRFVAAPDLSTVTEAELESTVDALETAGKNASKNIAPYVQAHIAPLSTLLGAKTGAADNGSVDFSDYKAASLELLNQCRPYL